jgi:hypothetical protein
MLKQLLPATICSAGHRNFYPRTSYQERQEMGEGVCVGLRCSLEKQNGLLSS